MSSITRVRFEWEGGKQLDLSLPWTTLWTTPLILRSAREDAGALVRLDFEWRSSNFDITITTKALVITLTGL